MSVYRIRVRIEGGDWVEEADGKVYRTLGTARGVLTRVKRGYRWWEQRTGKIREYKIQEAVTEWVDVDS